VIEGKRMVSPEGGVLRQHHSAALLLAPETTEATANAKRAATEANVTARGYSIDREIVQQD